MSESKIVWHKYPQEKPKNEGPYLITTKECDGSRLNVGIDTFFIDRNVFGIEPSKMHLIYAWAEMPEPYNPEENNNESR